MRSMQNNLARVLGRGSNKEGVNHWLSQRVTALALVPLSIWFVISALSLIGADYEAYKAWLGVHGNVVFLVLFLLNVFHHAQLGVQVVIEDYVHNEAAKVTSLIVVKFAAVLLAVSSVLAVLRVYFGG